PGSDAAAKARQARPDPCQPGQEVTQLGQLHLELPLFRPGPLRKDVEDQLGPVDDLHLEDALEIAALGWAELIVKDDEVGSFRADELPELLELARPQVFPRVGPAASLGQAAHHLGPGAFGQALKLV